MFGIKNRTFWTILIGVNITSAMLCAISGNIIGVGICGGAIVSCYWMLCVLERDEDK